MEREGCILSPLSRQDLMDLCEIYKTKALEEHDLFRKWRDRALEAESRLAIYEPDDERTEPTC